MRLHELLRLERPLIVFDCETTGPNPSQDRIVEFGFSLLRPDGTTMDYQTFVNPGVPIPREATIGNGDKYEGHGITDAMVQGCRTCGAPLATHPIGLSSESIAYGCITPAPWPTFRDLAPSLLRGFKDCDYAGFNVKRFDLPLLVAEFSRAGHVWSYDDAKVLDGYRLWQLGMGRTLSDAAETFLGRKHEGSHRVLGDVQTSVEVLEAQLERFHRLPRDLAHLNDLQWPVDPNAIDPDGRIIWKDGVVVMNFGKRWKGLEITKMTRRDLLWVANEATGMSPAVKAICLNAAEGRYPVKA